MFNFLKGKNIQKFDLESTSNPFYNKNEKDENQAKSNDQMEIKNVEIQETNTDQVNEINIHACYKCEIFILLDSLSSCSDISWIKVKLLENIPQLDQEDFTEMVRKCDNKTVVMVLESEMCNNFRIFWKLQENQFFWYLDLDKQLKTEYKSELMTFVTDFLIESLKKQHSGLCSSFDQKLTTTSIELDFLADSRDFNLLFLATERGNAEVVKILMNLNLSSISADNSISVQSLAMEHLHLDILLMFLQNNMTFPGNFNINNCTGALKDFCDVIIDLHVLIIADDVKNVEKILDNHKNLKHFYNFQNESAVRVALMTGSFHTYMLLLSRNFRFAPHENPREYFQSLRDEDKEIVRDIHNIHSDQFVDKHINVFMLNSSIFQDDKEDEENKRKIIQRAFEALNSNDQVRVVLMVVAAYMNFKIIFDFNSEAVDIVDPTADELTNGLFYFSGRICIAAKLLLNKATEQGVYAVMAHEICHFAMNVVFKNHSRPYKKYDDESMKEFEDIVQECQKHNGVERFIDYVYTYNPNVWHAELIVRVVHLLMLYQKVPDKLNEVKTVFGKLFEYFELKVLPEVEKALPEIEGRDKKELQKMDKKISKLNKILCYGGLVALIFIICGVFVTRILTWTCHYEKLSGENKLLIENGNILFKNETINLKQLFSNSSEAYARLKPEHCSELLEEKSLKFKDINYLFEYVSVSLPIIHETLEHAPVLFAGVNVEFQSLFPKDTHIYLELRPYEISKMLSNESLDFNNSHLLYLNENVTLFWENMTKPLKDQFLNSNFTFQDESLKLGELRETSPKSFYYLSNEQILTVLKGQNFTIHKRRENQTSFYIDRMFRDKNYNELKFKGWLQFMVEYYFSGEDRSFYKSNKTSESLNSMHELDKAGLYTSIINTIKNKRLFKEYDSEMIKVEFFKENYLTLVSANCNDEDDDEDEIEDENEIFIWSCLELEEVILYSNYIKTFILSDEAGAGKTVAFEQLAFKIKQEFPTKWVSYIDLKEHKKFYISDRYKDLVKLLEDILGLSSKNEFEKQIFNEHFESGNVVLLWNGFDEISPQYSEFVLNLLEEVQNFRNSGNIQYVSTRPLYADLIFSKLKAHQVFRLVPFDDQTQHLFLNNFLRSRNIDKDYIPKYIKKVQNIVKDLEKEEGFNTPLLLGMIAEVISNDMKIYESENLYEIYDKFVDKKIDIWLKKSEFAQNFSSTLWNRNSKFNMRQLYQKYALQLELGSLYYLKFYKLQAMRQKVPKELTGDEISQMAILYLNGPVNIKFSHQTFQEFFVAQFLVENIYLVDDLDILDSDQEAKLRIELFTRIFKNFDDSEKSMSRFVKYFVKTTAAKESKGFHRKIKKLFQLRFKNLLIESIYPDLDMIFKFLKFDKDILKSILHVNENSTFFTSTYNYFYSGKLLGLDHGYYKECGNILQIDQFSLEECQNYIQGRNQRGVILFSSYASYSMFKTNRTHEVYALDDNLLQNNDQVYVFQKISNNLTEIEFDELLLSTTSPVYESSFEFYHFQDESVWQFIELKLTKEKRFKMILAYANARICYSKINENFVWSKILNFSDNFVNEHEIYNLFYENDIFLTILKNRFKGFRILWEFFSNHTSHEQQVSMLRKRADDEIKPFNILQYVLVFYNYDDEKHDTQKFIEDLYSNYFKTSGIQELMTDSSSFFMLMIIRAQDSCNSQLQKIKDIFAGNNELLLSFFEQNVSETNSNVLEHLSDFAPESECYQNFYELYRSLLGE